MTLNAATVLKQLEMFMQEAGTYALNQQKTCKHDFKQDKSVVTETDLHVSKLFRERFAEYLNNPAHMLIDEEFFSIPRDEAVARDYQWCIDPIDGTATYAGGLPSWGIIISVFKKGEPWVAATYLPAMKLYYHADEQHAYETTDAFTPQAQTRKLEQVKRTFTPESQIVTHSYYIDQLFTQRPCLVLDFWGPFNETAVCAGQIAACIVRGALWDSGAGWTMAARTGYEFINVKTGKAINHLRDVPMDENYKLTGFAMLASRDMYDALTPFMKKSEMEHAA